MSKTTTAVFDPTTAWVRKAGKCPVCGMPATTTKKFKVSAKGRKDGTAKTLEEAMAELREDVTKWKAKPCVHVKCRG